MGKRYSTPSFILELEMAVTNHDRKILKKKVKIGKLLYNACLRKGQKLLRGLLAEPDYQNAVTKKNKISKQLKDSSKTMDKDRKSALLAEKKEVNSFLFQFETAFGYTEYSMQKFVTPMQHKFKENIGSSESHEIATRAFKSVELLHYHTAKKLNYKSTTEPFSIRNKSNDYGLRCVDQHILWGKQKKDYLPNGTIHYSPKKGAIKVPLIVKKNDYYAQEILSEYRIKYVQIIQKIIRGQLRWFAQLTLDGTPPKKTNMYNQNSPQIGQRVGLDLGTSTVAISSKKEVKLFELAPECTPNFKRLKCIERAMERARRVNNPDNYHPNGEIIKGKKLCSLDSKRYIKLKNERKELHRKLAVKRKSSHESLANHILSLGLDIRVESMNFKGLQKRAKKTTYNKKNGKINAKKRFGKTIANRAPAMLLRIIERKLGYLGLPLKKIDTKKVKASQFDHSTGTFTPKKLSVRWNNNIKNKKIQRDLYSAFLIQCTSDDLQSVDIDLANAYWKNFVQLHDKAIQRMHRENNPALQWYIENRN